MWAAGLLAAMSQLTYPSISAFVSIQSDHDKQGTVQGVITGIRGLCQGNFSFVFSFFNAFAYRFFSFLSDINMAIFLVKSVVQDKNKTVMSVFLIVYFFKFWI